MATLREFDLRYPQPVVGIDEAGLGCIAGPAFVVALSLPDDRSVTEIIEAAGAKDSKRMTHDSRERVFHTIQNNFIWYDVASASASEIDRVGLSSCLQRMYNKVIAKAKRDLNMATALLDGNPRSLIFSHVGVVGGDNKSLSIAAASIVAKVLRDRRMLEMAELFPQYEWEKNKGYPTDSHVGALRRWGPSPHHRYSTKTIKRLPVL
jgi:ribonuclease HII